MFFPFLEYKRITVQGLCPIALGSPFLTAQPVLRSTSHFRNTPLKKWVCVPSLSYCLHCLHCLQLFTLRSSVDKNQGLAYRPFLRSVEGNIRQMSSPDKRLVACIASCSLIISSAMVPSTTSPQYKSSLNYYTIKRVLLCPVFSVK